MTNQDGYKRISAVKDYKDTSRTIVKYRFTILDGEFSEAARQVFPSTSWNVGPAQGCVIVLDNNSIGLNSLFELSGIQMMPQLEKGGRYEAFGFCDEQELNSARDAFLKAASSAAQADRNALLANLARVDKALSIL